MKKATNRLRVLRAERDITQMDLSRKAGLELTRYWRIENGYATPNDAELRSLARVLKATAEEMGFQLAGATSDSSSAA
jgi:transcriptional regulator with XRE-family HTH domain